MDGTASTLQEKLERLLHEAAEVSLALDQAQGTIVGVPHYSVIEARAHQLGRQLSREIQARHMAVLTSTLAVADCPQCGRRCPTSSKNRPVTSIDGPTTLAEPVATCPACRRDFFPPPPDAGIRCS